MIVVLFTTTTLVAATPPNVTVAPVAKSIPVIVTAVPPAIAPAVWGHAVDKRNGAHTRGLKT